MSVWIIKTIVENCKKLKHINMLDIHVSNANDDSEESFQAVKLLSKSHFLESLAMNPCWLQIGITATGNM